MNDFRIREFATRRSRGLLVFARLPSLALIMLGVLLVWFALPTIVSLYPFWQGRNYSHAYLVLALTAALVVIEIRRNTLVPLLPSWTGLAGTLAVVLVMLAGQASTTLLVNQTALPLLGMAAVWAVFGVRCARRFVLPLSYLYFAIPVWELATEPLRRLTILVVSIWIRAANIPAFIEGNLIHVPSGSFEVMDGCAGLRYAIVAMSLATFVGLAFHRRVAPTALLVACALGLAVVGNWVRVFIIVVTGYVTEMQHPLVVEDHLFFGWVLFFVCMLPVVYVDRILQSRNLASPAIETRDGSSAGSVLSSLVTYTACAVFAMGVWLNHRIGPGDDPVPGTVALPALEIPGWERLADWEDVRRPYFAGTTAEAASWYAAGPDLIGAFVANYETQRQEREIVFAQNRPEGASGIIESRRAISIPAESGATIPFQEFEISNSDAERRLVWLGLRVAGRPAASIFAAKALQLVGAIRGRRDAQVLVLMAKCGDDCDQARSALARYAAVAMEPSYAQAERSGGARRMPHESKGGVL